MLENKYKENKKITSGVFKKTSKTKKENHLRSDWASVPGFLYLPIILNDNQDDQNYQHHDGNDDDNRIDNDGDDE